jgi:hypothetical protein
MTNKISLEEIAEVAWELYRGYCHAYGYQIGDDWDDLPQERRDRIIDGVAFHLARPDASPKDAHENWLKWMTDQGKDPDSPQYQDTMVPWRFVPQYEKGKGFVFKAVVNALSRFGSYGRKAKVKAKMKEAANEQE